MSEQAPRPESSGSSPEKKQVPLTDDCSRCDKKYALTPENTYIFHYTNEKENKDNLYCVCPHCDHRTRIFINEQTFETAVNNGIGLGVEKYAPEGVYEDWAGLKGIEAPETYELTNRHEAIIRKFGETLLAMPDEMLYQGFHDDTDKPYPQKWI